MNKKKSCNYLARNESASRLLQPVHRVIGQLELTVGKQYEFGRNQIPNDVAGKDSVSSEHLVLQLLDSNQVLIKDVSSYGTGAATMKSNSYDTKTAHEKYSDCF